MEASSSGLGLRAARVANYLQGEPDYAWPNDKTGDFPRERSVGSRFMGTYERWSRVMGGILEAAGVSGFLGNREELHADADSDRSEVEAFFAEWYERSQTPVTVDELVSIVSGLSSQGQPIPLPLELRGGKDLAQTLGYFLRKHKGALIGGHRLIKHPGRHSTWSLERVI